jgi:hypothetical protein
MQAGLPDGLITNQIFQVGHILEKLGLENVAIIYGHLEYVKLIWHTLWPFGRSCGRLVYFPPYWNILPRKIWQPQGLWALAVLQAKKGILIFGFFFAVPTRVARWHIFKPKISIWVNFGGPCNERCWYILCPSGIFHGYLVYLVAILYIP